MHETLFTYLSSNLASYFPSSGSTKNIFPKHIPDNALSNDFPFALVYNLITTQNTYTLYTHQIQLSVFGLDYGGCWERVQHVKDLFNAMSFSGQPNDFISTIVTDIVELEFDPKPQVYGIAVNVVIKSKNTW